MCTCFCFFFILVNKKNIYLTFLFFQIIDSEHLLALPEAELLQGNFKNKDKSPRYTQMMERFNLMSQWVASEIVSVSDASERATVMALMIKVAKVRGGKS